MKCFLISSLLCMTVMTSMSSPTHGYTIATPAPIAYDAQSRWSGRWLAPPQRQYTGFLPWRAQRSALPIYSFTFGPIQTPPQDLPNLYAKPVNAVPTPEPIINVRDYGAVGDGIADDYNAIQAAASAINAAQTGTLYFPPGTYYIGRHITSGNGVKDITFRNCNNLTITGYGAKIDVKGNYHRNVVSVRGVTPFDIKSSSNVIVAGFEIDGNVDKTTKKAGLSEPHNHGVSLTYTNAVTIRDIWAHHMQTDGIAVGDTSGGPADRNITIVNVRCSNNARLGLQLCQVRGAEILDSVFESTGITGGTYGSHSPVAGVDVEPNIGTYVSYDKRTASTAVKTGSLWVAPTNNGHRYKATVGGTTGKSQPVWPTTGGTVKDGTVTWSDIGTFPDVMTGDITFRNCTFRNSQGPQFVSNYASRVDNVSLINCSFYQETQPDNDNVILTVRNGLMDGCYVEGGNVFASTNSCDAPDVSNTTIQNCNIVSDLSGIVSSHSTSSNGTVNILNNQLTSTAKNALYDPMPLIQNSRATVVGNSIFVPATALGRESANVVSYIKRAILSSENNFSTDLSPTSGKALLTAYTGTKTVRHDYFNSGKAFLPAAARTWNPAVPYSTTNAK